MIWAEQASPQLRSPAIRESDQVAAPFPEEGIQWQRRSGEGSSAHAI